MTLLVISMILVILPFIIEGIKFVVLINNNEKISRKTINTTIMDFLLIMASPISVMYNMEVGNYAIKYQNYFKNICFTSIIFGLIVLSFLYFQFKREEYDIFN